MDLLPSAKFFLALWQSMQAKKHEKYPVHSILLFYPSSFSQKKRKGKKKKKSRQEEKKQERQKAPKQT